MERKNDRLPIFTERFKELQGERSNTEFADFLGISRQTVGFYYNGDRVPDALTLIKIAQKCCVSADWLLGLSDTKATRGEVKQVCQYTGLNEEAVDRLHWLVELNEYPKPCLTLIDNILKYSILHFRDFSYDSALYAIQAKRSSPQIPDDPDGCKKYFREKRAELFRNACKKTGEVDWEVKISAYEASRRSEERAVWYVSDAAKKTLSEYKKELEELIEATLAENENID